jgi:hypothetical protein
VAEVGEGGTQHADGVDAIVEKEAAVFCANDRQRQQAAHL